MDFSPILTLHRHDLHHNSVIKGLDEHRSFFFTGHSTLGSASQTDLQAYKQCVFYPDDLTLLIYFDGGGDVLAKRKLLSLLLTYQISSLNNRRCLYPPMIMSLNPLVVLHHRTPIESLFLGM